MRISIPATSEWTGKVMNLAFFTVAWHILETCDHINFDCEIERLIFAVLEFKIRLIVWCKLVFFSRPMYNESCMLLFTK